MELLTLPNEVLCDILKLLDWECLLAIKLTCRRLREVLKSPMLWIYKAAQLSLKSDSPVFEGPMECYSVEELEQKVIRRLQIHDRWRGPLAFRSRELDGVNCEKPGSVHLLPGGRWLLSNIGGRIYVLDLDKPKQPRQLIFEERSSTDTGEALLGPFTRSSIWVDSSKPWVSLRIAMYNRRSSESSGTSRIYIYQLDFSARGVNPTWTVKPMVTLMSCGSDFQKRLELEEDYIVERCFYANDDGMSWRVHLSRYSESGMRFVHWDYPTSALIILLSGDRLITFAEIPKPHAEIFNITIPNDSQSLVLEPSLRISLDFIPTRSTPRRLLVDRHFSYITSACKYSFQALQISHKAPGASPIVKRFSCQYGDDQMEPQMLLESSVMVVLRTRGGECWMDVITYDLRGDTEEIQVESHTSQQMFQGFGFGAGNLITCDEGSGRIIFYYDGAYWLLTV